MRKTILSCLLIKIEAHRFGRPVNIKEASKQATIYVGRPWKDILFLKVFWSVFVHFVDFLLILASLQQYARVPHTKVQFDLK